MALAVTPIAASEAWSGGASLAAGTVNTRLKEIQDYINAGVFDNAVRIGAGGSPAGHLYVKSPAAGTIGLVVDTAAGTNVSAQEWRNSGSLRAVLDVTDSSLLLVGFDNGSSFGPRLTLNRNSNGSTPASGWIQLINKNGADHAVWVDTAGKLRILASGNPVNANDVAGTVVGDQTSWYKAKQILRRWDDPTEALKVLLSRKVYDFRFKDRRYLDVDGQPAVFTGIVGFKRRDPFLKNVGRQQIPSLNEISLHGYTVLSIQALHRRIAALEKRRARLPQ